MALSERRFERLLRRSLVDDFYNDLRHVLRQFDHRAPILALAREIYAWVSGTEREDVRRSWAEVYYAAVIEQPPEFEVPEDRYALHAAALAWWQSLDDQRGERSGLRRCGSIDEVRLARGYHRLRKYAHAADQKNLITERLAAVAGVLAHVRVATPYARESDER